MTAWSARKKKSKMEGKKRKKRIEIERPKYLMLDDSLASERLGKEKYKWLTAWSARGKKRKKMDDGVASEKQKKEKCKWLTEWRGQREKEREKKNFTVR
jgi:hypothetical protein